MVNIQAYQKFLTPSEEALLTERQRDLHADFLKGGEVVYFEKKFNIHPGVFKPRPDSVPLVESMVINPEDDVLDVCCGSGGIGILGLYKGARSALGLDVNPAAVQCAILNAGLHGFSNRYQARESDVLSALYPWEKFSVVTINPPFRDVKTASMVERTTWDDDMSVHRRFFSGIRKFLKNEWRMYFAQASFGDLARVQEILDTNGWEAECVGRHPFNIMPGMEFFAFQVFEK